MHGFAVVFVVLSPGHRGFPESWTLIEQCVIPSLLLVEGALSVEEVIATVRGDNGAPKTWWKEPTEFTIGPHADLDPPRTGFG